jgi:hypothetical protein
MTAGVEQRSLPRRVFCRFAAPLAEDFVIENRHNLIARPSVPILQDRIKDWWRAAPSPKSRPAHRHSIVLFDSSLRVARDVRDGARRGVAEWNAWRKLRSKRGVRSRIGYGPALCCAYEQRIQLRVATPIFAQDFQNVPWFRPIEMARPGACSGRSTAPQPGLPCWTVSSPLRQCHIKGARFYRLWLEKTVGRGYLPR